MLTLTISKSPSAETFEKKLELLDMKILTIGLIDKFKIFLASHWKIFATH
jgi:hypothetical protein